MSSPITAPSFGTGSELTQFSHVVMNPPFGGRVVDKLVDLFSRFEFPTAQGEILALQHALSQCSGRLVSVCSNGVAFRQGVEVALRKSLIEKGWVEAVIQLPGQLFSGTSIPCIILVIDKNRKVDSPVMFVNADNEHMTPDQGRGRGRKLVAWEEIANVVHERKESGHSVLASREDIDAQGYDFSASRYVLSESSSTIFAQKNTTPLSSVAKVIRAQVLKSEEDGVNVFWEVGHRDIGPDGLVSTTEKRLMLSGKATDRAFKQLLMPGDILLSTRGVIGKVALIKDLCQEDVVAGQAFQIIRPTGDVNSIVLFRYLSSSLVQAYLEDQSSGSSMRVVKTDDIKNLPVPKLTLKEQEYILENYKDIMNEHEVIKNAQKRITSLSAKYWGLGQ